MVENVKCRVLYADPPWKFGDKLPGPGRGAEKHYDVMGDGKGGVDAICRFPLPHLEDDALLFLWRVSSQPEEALRVMRAWGFTPKSEIVWVKTKSGVVVETETPAEEIGLAFGMGRYVRLCHEVCLIGARGKAASLILNHGVRSVLFAPVGEHSVKPDAMYKFIETLSDGPYVELFARRPQPGWTQYGNELPGGEAAPDRWCSVDLDPYGSGRGCKPRAVCAN
jgi:N6-adenosine-specific RNA methylase IME4